MTIHGTNLEAITDTLQLQLRRIDDFSTEPLALSTLLWDVVLADLCARALLLPLPSPLSVHSKTEERNEERGGETNTTMNEAADDFLRLDTEQKEVEAYMKEEIRKIRKEIED